MTLTTIHLVTIVIQVIGTLCVAAMFFPKKIAYTIWITTASLIILFPIVTKYVQ